MINISTLFYSFEVLIAELIFVKGLEKRKYFWLRLFISFVITSSYAALFPFRLINGTPLISSIGNLVKFCSIFIVSVFSFAITFKTSIRELFIYCSFGYLVQNISRRMGAVIDTYVTLFDDLEPIILNEFAKTLLYDSIPYGIAYIWCKDFEAHKEIDARLDTLSVAIVIVSMCFSRVFDYMDRSQITVKIAQLFMSVSFAVPIFAIEYLLKKEIKQKETIAITDQLLKETTKEFKIWKSSVDNINIKVHDLKKIINYIEGDVSDKYLDEIKEALSVYESLKATGNSLVDNLMFQKNRICELNDISFTYMVDSKCLDFMDKEDVFALFSNIMDNAIEATMKIKDKEKRVIHMTVTESKGSVIIESENYFEGDLVIKDNKILTSKKDKEFHGFGIMSIEKICNKYNGVVKVDTSNNIFSLNIAI